MTQAQALRAWWTGLDQVDRARVLRMIDEDVFLPEDLALGMAMHGVTVVAANPSPVDGGPEGWFWPPVLDDFVAELREDSTPLKPGGLLCQECEQPVLDDQEWIQIPLTPACCAWSMSGAPRNSIEPEDRTPVRVDNSQMRTMSPSQ